VNGVQARGDAPAVSVLIPTYNRASFLPGTLASVFEQTIPVHEVLIVDDGSTDNTAELVASLFAQHPEWERKCRYLRQENQGKSVALNRALDVATGEWLAFLDSDDRWLPEKLEWQFRALREFPDCRACFTETSLGEFRKKRHMHPQHIVQDGSPIGRLRDPSPLYVPEFPGTYMQTVVVRRDAMQAFGKFDPRLRLGQDADFLFRLGFVTDFCFVDLPLVHVNREPVRAGLVEEGNRFRSLPRLIAQEVRLHSWLTIASKARPDLVPSIRHELASQRSELANRFLLEDDVRSARRILAAAVKECFEPRILLKWIMVWVMPGVLRQLANRRVAPEFARVSACL
jgi:glycosyltransferase involved in cell wall biosynthesis